MQQLDFKLNTVLAYHLSKGLLDERPKDSRVFINQLTCSL